MANEAVAAEVLARVQQADFVFLERLVLRVLTARGYGGPTGSIRHLGGPGDGGVDGVSRQVVLIDGPALARLMVQHNIGVQDQERYVLKRVDEDFFEEL